MRCLFEPLGSPVPLTGCIGAGLGLYTFPEWLVRVDWSTVIAISSKENRGERRLPPDGNRRL